MALTARAIGVLIEVASDPHHGGAIGLSKRLGEGRDAIQSAITDLKAEGLLEVVKNKMANGKIVSTLKLTDTGNQFLKNRIHILQTQLNLNSNLILDTNTDLLSHKPNRSAEEKTMDYGDTPMWLDPEEREEARRKDRERKHAEKMEFYEQRHKQRMEKRDQSNAFNWSATDAGFEFAEQMHNLWHVQPWKVTRSRFIYALDNKRKEYNTTGDVEQKMMKIFFDKLKHDTRINDPELIWKKFIIEFEQLLKQVQREDVSVEQVEEERERSQKSRSKLRDV